MTKRSLQLLLLFALVAVAQAREVYQTPTRFVEEAFGGDPPPPQVLWLDSELRQGMRRILNHDPGVLRLRYWLRDDRSLWILEEIGKEKPITTGVVVQEDEIERIEVLIYRETRGWEVRYPFFTDQFDGAGLDEDLRLDRHIDGISGATMSVTALKKQAQLALYLHRQVRPDEDKQVAGH